MDKNQTPKQGHQTSLEKHIKTKAGPNYSLIKDMRTSPLMLKTARDAPARDYITEHCNHTNVSKILPGQMIVFQYYEPKTKEELEYYDASPCTIFFGVFNTNEGKRVLGFNIHYYPPKVRRQVVNRIFEIYKPVYIKYFTEGIKKEIDAFDYKYLIESLEKAKLSFGVRMYIPELIGLTWAINPNQWQVAAFTEGWFKKRSRQAILKYWKNFKEKHSN